MRDAPASQHRNQPHIADRIDPEGSRAPAAATMSLPSAGPTHARDVESLLSGQRQQEGLRARHHAPTEACQAGALNAAPQPMANVNISNSHGVIHPLQAHTISATDTTSMNTCAPIITRRRSRLSATAPATSDSSTTGNVRDVCTSATMSADCAIETISHDAQPTG